MYLNCLKKKKTSRINITQVKSLKSFSPFVQASSSGCGGSWDLLSPLSLFHFAAVTKTKDPPARDSEFWFCPALLSISTAQMNFVILIKAVCVFAGMQTLQVLGLVYFCYLFLFSGLEFTLSFLTHQRFQFTRSDFKDKAADFISPWEKKELYQFRLVLFH